MAPKSLSLLIILSVAVALFSDVASAGVPGGYQPIQNLKDPEVQKIGKFAVTEHNEEAKTKLELVEILRGEKQVVAGFNYRLVIAAKTAGGGTDRYAVVVFEDLKDNLKLVSFKTVN